MAISAITFLRYGDRAIVQMPPVPQGTFSMWIEERKLPPLDEAVLRKSALYTPLLSTEWQDRSDPAPVGDDVPENPPFFYDGKFVTNPAIPGKWTLADVVKSTEDFQPAGKKVNAGRAAFQSLNLTADGGSDSPLLLWSGDTLMDIDQRAALKMTPKTIDGAEYLFVESGGFSPKHPVGWKTTLTVFKRN